jgi:hypothetical protein
VDKNEKNYPGMKVCIDDAWDGAIRGAALRV